MRYIIFIFALAVVGSIALYKCGIINNAHAQYDSAQCCCEKECMEYFGCNYIYSPISKCKSDGGTCVDNGICEKAKQDREKLKSKPKTNDDNYSDDGYYE